MGRPTHCLPTRYLRKYTHTITQAPPGGTGGEGWRRRRRRGRRRRRRRRGRGRRRRGRRRRGLGESGGGEGPRAARAAAARASAPAALAGRGRAAAARAAAAAAGAASAPPAGIRDQTCNPSVPIRTKLASGCRPENSIFLLLPPILYIPPPRRVVRGLGRAFLYLSTYPVGSQTSSSLAAPRRFAGARLRFGGGDSQERGTRTCASLSACVLWPCCPRPLPVSTFRHDHPEVLAASRFGARSEPCERIRAHRRPSPTRSWNLASRQRWNSPGRGSCCCGRV
jgi:hypothetical protein